MTELVFERDGAVLARLGATDVLERTLALADTLPQDHAGVRLHGAPALLPIIGADSSVAGLASELLTAPAFPVRAVLFDKTPERNWSLAWHQDRTIVVRRRLDVDGFGPWTIKAGLVHVAPPMTVLWRMVTVRIHLDPVPADNAPLLIAPGSHTLGRIAEADIAVAVERYGTRACLAEAGDVWLYATPILHASDAARSATRRRVLQVDYAADALPDGLEWLGV